MKIDIKHKLTSRKLWLAVAGFTASIVGFFLSPDEVVQVVTAVTALGNVAMYLFSETRIDEARCQHEVANQNKQELKNDLNSFFG